MITTGQLFLELSNCGGWREQPRRMRWAAARYYTGVDSYEDLRALAVPDDCLGDRAILTQAQVDEIIQLR